MSARHSVPIAMAALCLAAPAAASLPDPVRAMIEAAIATGNKDKIAAVVEAAKATNPEDHAEIDALHGAFLEERKAAAELAAQEKEQALRTAGVFESWGGKGEIGAYLSSGNSSNEGLTAGLTLDRKGIDWSHKLRGRMDYQRANGRTSREQYFASYEPRYQIDQGLFAYGLAQYEQDRIQGFTGRYAISGGVGYHVIDGTDLDLSIKAGPAFRVTDYVTGETDSRLAALFGADFDWRISERLTFTQDSNMVAETGAQATLFVDSRNTTLNLVTGLEAKVSDRLTTRLSYQVDYNSDPRPGAVATDTLSRFTLVYGFGGR
jgi:putative salt-induced outer membrane protein